MERCALGGGVAGRGSKREGAVGSGARAVPSAACRQHICTCERLLPHLAAVDDPSQRQGPRQGAREGGEQKRVGAGAPAPLGDAVTAGRAPGKAARRHLITAAASTNAAIATTRATVIATYMEAGAKPCRFASSGVQAHQPLPKLAANHNAASSVVVGRSDATQRPRTGRSAPPSLCGQPMARRGRRARSARSSLAGGSPTVPSPSQPSPPPRAATMRLCASADASARLRGSSRVTPLPPALMLARTCAASPPLPAEMSQRGLSGSAKAAAASTAAAGSATRQR